MYIFCVIVKYVSQLESLDISGATFPLLEVFKNLPQPLMELKTIKMNNCSFLNEDG